jgi:DNA-binding Xre family transcriptional regulator
MFLKGDSMVEAIAGNVRLRVPELLRERGWNITEFSHRSRLSYPTAHRLAHGNVSAITLDMIDKLCRVFEVKIEDLIVRESDGH